ncbi:SH3 domain-containing protein [Ruminococcus sp.]|uniref:SH3 domain-containing protein n=1 Tax=Ruminococcus sp. TaxID=41978 RepID=UPI0025CBB0C5|nr:SH3 domain-containing protein [Ruminococcus sp.]MBR1432495.1 SH3 domain-containing protein [Ruminococcus sp.]
MKKMITCLAILTMLSTMVSCGIDDIGETSGSTPDIITSTSSLETAGTKSSEPETEAAETAPTAAKEKTEAKAPANAENDEATAAAPAADNAQPKAPANEAPKEPLVLNENERLFGGYVDTKGGDLNMREEPFTSAEVIGSIPDGTQINVFSCGKAGWYATSFNGKTGYISADFVNEIPSDNTGYFLTDISELVGQWKYQVAPEGMNITAGVTDNGIIDI